MAKRARPRHAFSLVAVASLVHTVHSKSCGFQSTVAPPASTRSSLATNNEDVNNRTETVEIPYAHLTNEGTQESAAEAIDKSLAVSLERSRRFQADQDALLHVSQGSEAVDAAMAKLASSVERTGPRALAKKLMCGTKLLFADLMQWRRLRLLPEESLTYDEVRLAKEMPAMMCRMLPLVANPLPPPFGLVLLALANTRPRTFLTRHYYSDAQMLSFASADSWAAHRRYRKVTALVAGTEAEEALRLAAQAIDYLLKHPSNHDDDDDDDDDGHSARTTGDDTLAAPSSLSKHSRRWKHHHHNHRNAIAESAAPTTTAATRSAAVNNRRALSEVRRRRMAAALLGAFEGPNDNNRKGVPPAQGNSQLSNDDDDVLSAATTSTTTTTTTTTSTLASLPPSSSPPAAPLAPAGPLHLPLLSPAHLRQLLKAQAASTQSTAGLPGVPSPLWALALAAARGHHHAHLTALLHQYAAALAEDDQLLLRRHHWQPPDWHRDSGSHDSTQFSSSSSSSSSSRESNDGPGGSGRDSSSDSGSDVRRSSRRRGLESLRSLPEARLRAACLERGLLYRGSHLTTTSRTTINSPVKKIPNSRHSNLRPGVTRHEEEEDGAVLGSSLLDAITAQSLKGGTRSAPGGKSSAEDEKALKECEASAMVVDTEEMCVRLGRYLEVVHALRSASLESSGAPLPPSLLLHLPLLLASE